MPRSAHLAAVDVNHAERTRPDVPQPGLRKARMAHGRFIVAIASGDVDLDELAMIKISGRDQWAAEVVPLVYSSAGFVGFKVACKLV